MYENPGDEYVGHDEPSVLFESGVKGSGNDITYTITLPKDPKEQPTASGATGTTWNFQLRPTFWFGLTLCDTESAPNFTKFCKPDFDSNNLVGTDPTKKNYIGKHPGNAYMELQFYGPGYVPQERRPLRARRGAGKMWWSPWSTPIQLWCGRTRVSGWRWEPSRES